MQKLQSHAARAPQAKENPAGHVPLAGSPGSAQATRTVPSASACVANSSTRLVAVSNSFIVFLQMRAILPAPALHCAMQHK